MDMKKEKKEIGFWKGLKLELMLKWFDEFGFNEILSDFPECQLKFGEKLKEYLTPQND